MVRELAEKIGVDVTFVPITTEDVPQKMLEQENVDLVLPCRMDGGEQGIFQTQALYATSIKMAVLTGHSYPKKNSKIAVLSTEKDIGKILKDAEPSFEIVYYDNVKAAMRAVRNKKATALAGSAYVLSYLLENPRYNEFNIAQPQDIPVEVTIGGRDNAVLESILSKGIARIKDDDFQNIVSGETQFDWDSFSAMDKLFTYRYIIWTALIGAICILILFHIYSRRKSNYIRQIEKKSREAEEASAAKTEFLSRMSHEIRTPMNAILGMASMALESDDKDEMGDCVGQIQDSSQYLLQLINDILDMSKIENGKVILQEKFVNGPEFLLSIAEMMKVTAQKRNITLIANFSKAKAVWVKMDTLRSKQIYVNLLNNAIKFSPDGGTIHWNIEDKPVDASHIHIICTIRDEGCGMSREFQKKMFLPFEQEHNQYSDKTPGTGLGLSIVKSLIERMGGTIECESELGKGTAFVIQMDREISAQAPAEQTQTEKIDEKALKGKHILLAEDNEVNAKVAIHMLKSRGLLVERAGNGKEALRLFEKEPDLYDAILMDVRMPVMDGLEATRRIRALGTKKAKNIPIIAMTADAFRQDMDRTREAGMNAHLSKPIDVKIMFETLMQFINQ